MSDQEVVKLLEEIRELQRLQVENSKAALANQQLAIDTQKNSVRRSKVSLIVLFLFLGVCLALMLWSTFGR